MVYCRLRLPLGRGRYLDRFRIEAPPPPSSQDWCDVSFDGLSAISCEEHSCSPRLVEEASAFGLYFLDASDVARVDPLLFVYFDGRHISYSFLCVKCWY